MTHRYLPPALLTNDHVVESFECRSVEQTQWLRRLPPGLAHLDLWIRPTAEYLARLSEPALRDHLLGPLLRLGQLTGELTPIHSPAPESRT